MTTMCRNRRSDKQSNLWSRSLHLVAVCLALVLMIGPCAAQTQSNTVAIESSRMQPSLVVGRPMLTWWDVKIEGPGLAVGKFRFEINHDKEFLGSFETEELTLNGPEQRIRVLLPSVDTLSIIDQLQVNISYSGKGFTGKLGQHILRVPFANKKVFNCLLVESPGVRKVTVQRDRLMESLRFENVVLRQSPNRKVDEDRDQAKTIYPSLDAADLPAEPISLCSYDVIAVASDVFRSLRKPQLQALLAWTRAGGSTYVEPGGVLEPYHLEFLRDLIAAKDPTEIFRVDAAGKLEFDDQERDAISVECGIGHAIVRISDPGKTVEIESESWRKITRPLWKARYEPMQDRTLTDDRMYQGTPAKPFSGLKELVDLSRLSLAGQYRHSATNLLRRLMPEGVRMVPVWLLALILTTYVALIGPGDYYFLGWLRSRKMTWLTFPATTLVVAVVTIWLSNMYMSTSEARRGIMLTDLDKGGQVVRTNRVQLTYIASSRWVPTTIEKGYLAPLKAVTYKLNPGTNQFDDDSPDIRMTTEGRIPTEYRVTQFVPKWTPQINRIFSIPAEPDSPKVDWIEWDLDKSKRDQILKHSLPANLMETTRKNFGQGAMVACFAGVGGWAFDQSPGWYSNQSQPQSVGNIYPGTRSNYSSEMLVPELRDCKGAGAPEFFLWIYGSSVAFAGNAYTKSAPASNLFAITNQTAPKGSSNCDDLPLLDVTDPDAWLLTVLVPNVDDLIVYRKRMRFTAAAEE